MLSTTCLTLVYITANDYKKITNLNATIDSLKLECNLKDTAIDEATKTAIQLSDRLNVLYEKSPSIHKAIFSH
jgi:hypothetical protein